MRSPAGFAGDEGRAVASLSPSYAWVFVNPPGLFPPPSAAGFALRLIPGTDSVWASAALFANSTDYGGMLKYGP